MLSNANMGLMAVYYIYNINIMFGFYIIFNRKHQIKYLLMIGFVII